MFGNDLETGKHISVDINSIKDYNSYVKKIEHPLLDISVSLGTELVSSDLYTTRIMFQDINYLVENFEDLINDFSPHLLDDLTKNLEKIVLEIVESATKHKTIERKVVFEEPSCTTDLGMYVYTKVVATDEVKRDVDELEKLVDKLDKVRSELLTTAYA